jgi:Uma2 family endonuclease
MTTVRNLPARPTTLDEFLVWEASQDMKHEYRRGAIRMMTGGTLRNTRIAQNIAGALNDKLASGPCFAYVENAKVRLDLADAGYYPDVVVDCGGYDPDAKTTAEPVVVFEVLSTSTRNTDFSDKVPDYRDTPSVRQIVLVEPDKRFLHVWVWDEGRQAWRETDVDEERGVLKLPALDVELTLEEIYKNA